MLVCSEVLTFVAQIVFHGLFQGDSLTPIRATQNTRRALIAGQQSLSGGTPCSPLEWHRFRCRNHDCCNNKLPRCNQAFACVAPVLDHGGECGTSWEHGSEISDLAPCHLPLKEGLFPIPNYLRSLENCQRSQPHLCASSDCSLDLIKHAR